MMKRSYEALHYLMCEGAEKLINHPRTALTLDEMREIMDKNNVKRIDNNYYALIEAYHLGVETGFRIAEKKEKVRL